MVSFECQLNTVANKAVFKSLANVGISYSVLYNYTVSIKIQYFRINVVFRNQFLTYKSALPIRLKANAVLKNMFLLGREGKGGQGGEN